jgi:hypothetical protein
MANDDFISFLGEFSDRIKKIGTEQEVFNGVLPSKTRLSDTNKGARVNARLDSMLKGQPFDESSTPPGELETADQDVEDEIVNRVIEEILGE